MYTCEQKEFVSINFLEALFFFKTFKKDLIFFENKQKIISIFVSIILTFI
jgi:hypothetical protein